MLAVRLLARAVLVASLAAAGPAATTTPPLAQTLAVSVDVHGLLAGSDARVVMTPDARYLVFVSSSLDLPGGSLDRPGQVYRRDLLTGSTRLVSAGWYGAPADAAASPESLAISPTGRYVAYVSRASNIPVRNGSSASRLFVRDLDSHQTYVANSRTDAAVSQEAAFGRELVFSADDRYLFYASASPNLVDGQSNGRMNVYRWERADNFQSTVVSRAVDGTPGTGDSGFGGLAVSADGRFVAYDSTSPNLVRGVVAPGVHTYVLDVGNSTTKLVDRTPSGAVSAGTRGSLALSADGRYVAFEAGQDVGGHDGTEARLYRRDLQRGRTELVTVPGFQLPVTGRRPALSADGRYVGFVGEPVLVDPPTYPTTFFYPAQAYVRDMQARSVRLVSAQPDGLPIGGGDRTSAIRSVTLSADGRFAGYATSDRFVLPLLGSSPGGVDGFNSYRVGPLH